MKQLLALRHARAAAREEYPSDRERPLTEGGISDARRLGALIHGLDLVPQLIVSSSALRARQTAEAVAESMRYGGAVAASDELYEAASGGDYLDALLSRAGDADSVMLVGHNPAMESFVRLVSGSSIDMKTCHLAVLEAEAERWADVTEEQPMRLHTVLTPEGVKD